MAENLYTGPRFAAPLGTPVPVAMPGAGLAGVPLPPVVHVETADLQRTGSSPFLKAGDTINYAPPIATTVRSTSIPGVPSLEGIAEKFAAVPAAPVRPTGGFTDQAAALEYGNALRAHSQALNDAKTYAQTAKYLHDIHQEAATEVEAGDFLSAFSNVRADAEDFDDQVRALYEKNPNAAGHRAVQESVELKRQSRQNNYNLSRERDDRDEKSDQVIATAGGAGLISSKDRTEPGVKHPEIDLPTVNKNGTPNRRNILLLIAKRQGAQKDEQGETREQSAERRKFDFYSKQLDAMKENSEIDKNSAEFKQTEAIVAALYPRIVQRDAALLAKPVAGAATGATGPAAPAGPRATTDFIIRKRW